MPATNLTPYDVADHLRTPAEMAAYLEACLEYSACDPNGSPRRSRTLDAR